VDAADVPLNQPGVEITTMTTNAFSQKQRQTEDTFAYKWRKRETYESPHMQAEWRRWMLEKYFDGDSAGPERLLGSSPKRILDAGCGSGGSAKLLFGDLLRVHSYVGIDVSDAVEVARIRFEESGLPGQFYRHDLNAIPEALGAFDIVFSEGVLHHTDSVRESLMSLSRRMHSGGRILFYVYARKGPIREFTDDHVRRWLNELDNEAAWEALKPLTLLGKELGQLGVEVQVPEDIPFLGIVKGRYDLQRLFYYSICKAYYRPGYTIDEMNHINFDWFRPANCHRHEATEIREFCSDAGLVIERLHTEASGITVIGRRD
jgi:arsenite methyltransferase